MLRTKVFVAIEQDVPVVAGGYVRKKAQHMIDLERLESYQDPGMAMIQIVRLLQISLSNHPLPTNDNGLEEKNHREDPAGTPDRALAANPEH